MKNPFSPTHPAEPKYFVNREEIISDFKKYFLNAVNMKETPRPDNIGIIGMWGSGKTSLLRKLEDIIQNEMKEIKSFTVQIKLTPTSCKDMKSFTYMFLNEFERNFNSQLNIIAQIKKELSTWRLRAITYGGLTVKKEESIIPTVSALDNALRDLWTMLNSVGIEIGVIMLDDVHYLAKYCPEGLLDVRSIFQGLPSHKCNYMLVVTGYPHLFPKARELAEPFSRFFYKYHLENFSKDETKQMILKPLKQENIPITIDEDVQNKIYELTEGHPFFISFIMREIVDSGIKFINIQKFEELFSKISKKLKEEKFEYDYKLASKLERAVLLKLAELQENIISPSQLKINGASILLERLVEKDLILKHARGEYSLYHPLFKEYLKSLR